MKLDNRKIKIIDILLNMQEYTSCADIAKKIGVSDRTVLNEINKINEIKDLNHPIKISRGNGVKIKDFKSSEKLYSYINRDRFQDRDLTGEIIKKLLIYKLFNRKFFLQDISEDLYISLSLLKNKLKDVSQVLREYGLELISSNIEGTYIIGEEKDIRYCMSDYLFSSNLSKNDEYFSNMDIFSENQYNAIKKIVLEIFEYENISLTYIAFTGFLTHLVISVARSSIPIEYTDKEKERIKDNYEFKIVEDIIDRIYQKLDIDLSKDIYYLTEHLMLSQRFITDIEENKSDNRIDLIILEIIDQINSELSIDLSDDEMFYKGLKMHLTISLKKYEKQVSKSKIDLDAIKIQYPAAYDMGLIAARVIKKHTNYSIGDNEILYLSTHLGAAQYRKLLKETSNKAKILIICGAGLSTGRLLKYKLLDSLESEVEKIDVINYSQFNSSMEKDYDLILSTVNSDEFTNKVVIVDYFLSDPEIKLLRNRISKSKKEDITKNIFSKDLFYKKNLSSKKEVLNLMLTDLYNKGLANEDIVKSVYEREKLGNTYIGNKVAIPHPLKYMSNEMKISVLINESDIAWDNNDARIVFLILIPKNKINVWDKIFRSIYKYFNTPGNLENILQANNFEEFLYFINKGMDD